MIQEVTPELYLIIDGETKVVKINDYIRIYMREEKDSGKVSYIK